jgi:importin subunit alpha-1
LIQRKQIITQQKKMSTESTTTTNNNINESTTIFNHAFISPLNENTTTTSTNEKLEKRLQNLPTLVHSIQSTNIDEIKHAIEDLRKILSQGRRPPIAQVIETGIVPRLVELISEKYDEYPEIQLNSTWCITNIASGTSVQTKTVIDCGSIPELIRLLRSKNDDLIEQDFWALGNISGDSVAHRNLVLENGLFPLLVTILMAPEVKIELLRQGTWLLSNLLRGKPSPPNEIMTQSIPILIHLLTTNNDDDIVVNSCWSLNYICNSSREMVDVLMRTPGVSTELLPKLVALLGDGRNRDPLVSPILGAIRNIAASTNEHKQLLIDAGVVEPLHPLLSTYRSLTVKETCLVLAELLKGSTTQIQAVMDKHVIPSLITLMYHSQLDVRTAVGQALANAISNGSNKQIEYVVKCGVVKPFCMALTEKDSDQILVALDALENILKVGTKLQKDGGLDENPFTRLMDECDGISSLEELQINNESEVRKRALRVIDEYFNEVEIVAQPKSANKFI